jgi:hypothetical protein
VTQVSKEEFVKISHDYAIAAAKLLKTESPGAAFHYQRKRNAGGEPHVLIEG